MIFILVCLSSALTDYRHHPEIVATMARFRLPVGFEVVAGAVKNIAAFGLILGLTIGDGYGGLTFVTAVCLTLYFAIAIGFHVRARDSAAQTAPAGFIFLMALAFAIVSR